MVPLLSTTMADVPKYLSWQLPAKDITPLCVVATVRSKFMVDSAFAFSVNCSNKKFISVGKKGVLWWQIRDILIAKKTPFVLLENVVRLIKSPAKQRGRAFGLMLKCMDDLGYAVEWRVINASD